MVRTKKNIVQVTAIWLWFLSPMVFATGRDLHFWPTPISVSDPQSSGVLFAWPEYNVILQTKGDTAYAKALIDDGLAQHLSDKFAPGEGSLIKIHRDAVAMTWGLTIPGGPLLRHENLRLLPSIAEKFIACLSTLEKAKLDLMKEVIYAPFTFIASDGGVSLHDEHHAAALAMVTRFQANRCVEGTTVIPELLREKTINFISVFLSGQGHSIDTLPGTALVLTTLFGDLLFSQKGLWVRATLALIQDFIEQRIATVPAIKDKTILERDYESFIDFILLTRETAGLTKEHYLSIAHASNIDGFMEAFEPFPVKQRIIEGRLIVANIHLGSRQSTFFFNGAQR